MTYLIISEGGDITQTSTERSEEDFTNCNDGYMDIVRVVNSKFEQYLDGKWEKVEEVD
jgi:hypothetical protein